MPGNWHEHPGKRLHHSACTTAQLAGQAENFTGTHFQADRLRKPRRQQTVDLKHGLVLERSVVGKHRSEFAPKHHRDHGIYIQLDSACKGPSPSGRAFCAGLHQSHGKDPKSKTFGAPKISKTEKRGREDYFVVHHFAGDVVYHTAKLVEQTTKQAEVSWLEKNNDTLDPGWMQTLTDSSVPMLKDMFLKEHEEALKATKKTSFSSVSNIVSSVSQYEALKYVSFPTQVIVSSE